MATVSLAEFIDANRDELIGRCRAKVATRTVPPPTEAEIDHGVPLLLSQLSKELRRTSPQSDDISRTAREHGRELLGRGFTVDQVVRDYGDVCQSVTELAVETKTAISAGDFRTLNQCLDDAIAAAVTEFAETQDSGRDGELSELWSLVNAASAAFDALQSGRVGVAGATARVVGRSLGALRAFVDRREVNEARAAAARAAVPNPVPSTAERGTTESPES